jgi:hypothetical protein
LTGEEITAKEDKNLFQNKRYRTSESLLAVLTIGITISDFQSTELVIPVIHFLTLLAEKSDEFLSVSHNEALSTE